MAGLALAKLCYETLMTDGVKAKVALEKGALTPAVEHIIEANTLLSGIGFESSGLAAAHAIHNGLTLLPGVPRHVPRREGCLWHHRPVGARGRPDREARGSLWASALSWACRSR